MEVLELSLDKITPYARNPRKNLDAVNKVVNSIKEFGFKQPVVVDSDHVIIAGHTRYLAAQKLNLPTVPVLIAKDLSPSQVKAYRLADNRVAEEASWDNELLGVELEELKALDFDLFLTGFDDDEIASLLGDIEELPIGEADAVPELPEEPVSIRGDVWLLGSNRLMCGDSTYLSDVEKLMDGKKIVLLHADPPYGMGKESEGVKNDNLYEEELDKFQMEWFATFLSFLENNASVYIWGNAAELWRLWYKGGLEKTDELRVVNEIVWAKVHSGGAFDAIGQKSDDMRCYPTASERCLFLTFGKSSLNTNSDNYFDGWEPVRSYLHSEFKKSGLTRKKVEQITGCQMFSHWFSKSQWQMIDKENYTKLYEASNFTSFTKPYSELYGEYLEAKKVYDGEVVSKFYSGRAYFDNSHDVMADVWNFERVKGEERHGHATPKPVEMMERIIKSSSRKGDVVAEPFGGSGSTLIACQKLGRPCNIMELSEKYCDVIITRWQNLTGKKAVHEELKITFEEIKHQRNVTNEERESGAPIVEAG